MNGDKLIISLGSGRFALNTKTVAGIVECAEIPFLPGQSGFVTGIISFRNDPVVVVDARAAIGEPGQATPASHKIIVLAEKGRSLGIDIGEAEVSFMWDEDIEGSDNEYSAPYSSGRVHLEDGAVNIIDWQALFNETSTILSAGGHA